MKQIILWLVKVFNVDLPEKVVIKEVEKIVEKQVALHGTIEGDVTVKGNLLVEGSLTGTGEVTCFKINSK
jgi:cytoskeletal protein CcmA (bactofilin family)